MSNGRSERMVGTIKKSIVRLVLDKNEGWDSYLFAASQGYRRLPLCSCIYRFEILQGVKPRLIPSDQNPFYVKIHAWRSAYRDLVHFGNVCRSYGRPGKTSSLCHEGYKNVQCRWPCAGCSRASNEVNGQVCYVSLRLLRCLRSLPPKWFPLCIGIV